MIREKRTETHVYSHWKKRYKNKIFKYFVWQKMSHARAELLHRESVLVGIQGYHVNNTVSRANWIQLCIDPGNTSRSDSQCFNRFSTRKKLKTLKTYSWKPPISHFTQTQNIFFIIVSLKRTNSLNRNGNQILLL